MSRLHAYCGLDCAACPVYAVTMSGDEVRKQELAQQMTSEKYPLTAEDIKCHGCSTGGELISFCAGCDIRACAILEEQESCAFCETYPCDKLEKHLAHSPDSRATLEQKRSGLSNKQVLAEALELLASNANMAVSTVDNEGFPRTRALMKTRFDGLQQIVFTTINQSDKVAQLRANNKTSIHIADYANIRALTLWGTMEILEDRESKAAAWLEGFEKFYPQGIDTPWLCVLRFTTLGGQYYKDRPYDLTGII